MRDIFDMCVYTYRSGMCTIDVVGGGFISNVTLCLSNSIFLCVYIYIHIHIHTYIYIYIYMCVGGFEFETPRATHTHTHTYTYIYIYIYTQRECYKKIHRM